MMARYVSEAQLALIELPVIEHVLKQARKPRRPKLVEPEPVPEKPMGPPEEGKTRIPDGPDRFPDSTVMYTHFLQTDVRVMFAYLREKELVLQKDLKRTDLEPHERMAQKAKLHEVQSHLEFMCANFTYDAARSEEAPVGEDE